MHALFRSRRRWRRDAKRTTNFVNSTTMSARRFNGSTERTTASESCVGRRMDRIYSRASVIPPMKSCRYRPTRTTTGRGLTVGHPAGIPAPSSPGVLRPIVGCNSTSNPLLVWGGSVSRTLDHSLVVAVSHNPDRRGSVFSTHQKYHAKTGVTGLVGPRNWSMESISTGVLPAKGGPAVTTLLTEYEWDEAPSERRTTGASPANR